jgi:uncharacterized membrane protein YdbT with pleckstrin-like domain
MIQDFTNPQRQSPVGVLVMFFDTIKEWVRHLWPLLLLWTFKLDRVDQVYITIAAFFTIMLLIAVAYLRYRNFQFWLDEQNGEFVIQEGIVSKTRTAIQLGKIQQVNINQNLLQQLIQVYSLEVDTAGSTGKEVSIKAVSHQTALALKARLLDNEEFKEALTEESPQQAEINIGLPSLIKVGLTSNYLRTFGLLLAAFFTLWDGVRNAGAEEFAERNVEQAINNGMAMRFFGILLVLFFGAFIVINVLRIVVKYMNFRIIKQQGSLLMTYGSINIRSTIIKPEKVQVVRVVQNYFQRKLNVSEIKIRQAAPAQDKQSSKDVEVPGCSAQEREALFNLLFRQIPSANVILKPNYRKLLFSFSMGVVLPIAIFSLLLSYRSDLQRFVYLIIPYLLFVVTVLFFSFRNYRLMIGPNHIIKQSGAWDVAQEIMLPSKIQSVTLSQLFWHKRLNIGSLTLHTAAGDLHFRMGKFDEISKYVNLWLYELESKNTNWY